MAASWLCRFFDQSRNTVEPWELGGRKIKVKVYPAKSIQSPRTSVAESIGYGTVNILPLILILLIIVLPIFNTRYKMAIFGVKVVIRALARCRLRRQRDIDRRYPKATAASEATELLHLASAAAAAACRISLTA
ncbi:hypothetical protein FPQ18DRAFT_300204 [Pyronema domesticum]|nr:hypothetical protein FPQ18DRAFT_300204 [Pyronema domesticum]